MFAYPVALRVIDDCSPFSVIFGVLASLGVLSGRFHDSVFILVLIPCGTGMTLKQLHNSLIISWVVSWEETNIF